MRGSLPLALETVETSHIFSLQKVFERLALLYFSSTQRPEGRRGKIITSCCQNFPPTLSITLYFYCKLDAPPPLTVLRKFVYFAIAQFGRKSKKQSTMFCIPIFTANTEWRNYLPIRLLVITPEFYGGVNRRNIDLWPKTKLHHVNYQRDTSLRKRDCPSRKTEIN